MKDQAKFIRTAFCCVIATTAAIPIITSYVPKASTSPAVVKASSEKQNAERHPFKLQGGIGWVDGNRKLVLAPSPYMWDNCRLTLDDRFVSEYAGTKLEFHSIIGGETKQIWASEFMSSSGERFQYHPGTKVRVDCYPKDTLVPDHPPGYAEVILN